MLAACALGACSQRHDPSPLATPAPATPSPAPTWSPGERAGLQHAMASIFSDDITQDGSGIAVVAADGTRLFERRALVPVTPASTLKLLVAASALDAMGPQHRFETRFVAAAPPDASGTVRGGIWLVGGGDPSLTSDQLRNGVAALWQSGVRRIDGPLEVDDSAFSGPEQNPRWDPSDLTYDYAAGTSAISLDDDTVQFDVEPDPAGGAARISVVPANESISFTGRIASGGSSSFVTIVRKPETPHVGTDPARAPEPRNEYVVDGNVAQGDPQRLLEPVLGMPGYVGGAAAAMFAQRGIGLAGGFRAGVAPLDAVTLWAHRSAPLADLVHEMLVNSNNHTAEQLLRILGETSGHAGTDAAGIAVEKRQLSQLHVPRDHMAVYDASGLAPADKIMPLTLVKLLAAQARSPYGSVYVRSLPRAGIEGTVQRRDLHDALGRTRAKSGHIENVNGLAGYVQTRHHGRIAFAFEVNGPRANADVVYEEEDNALDTLSDF
ncbi:MAG: D-alanyl-D-alanine carboxypeptidase/D-alanyl-D-alanine-endopeptidase [Candidatus Eremiobacteraeota bacterium]|nr:D-alanyl-D-alanine carboxypeptidase/D-alanyl-D-alanine-endopeptidase [Candidatus Eremiobacteraeota bacterium]MBC5820939.1 D-alanyl-D-alanine carboxypeptidase/D-alanyl-D-alanine-endopeptidase [Candidatus Eremiobacteraeota bacterium]